MQSSTDVVVSGCDNIVLNPANCQLFSLGSLTENTVLDLAVDSGSDVALFAFSIAADSEFLALTSSLGFDTMLGLFDATGPVPTRQSGGG